MKSTYGYIESEEEIVREDGYIVSSYNYNDEENITANSDTGFDSALHEDAYSQTAIEIPPSVDERVLTGRYSTPQEDTSSPRVQEPSPDKSNDTTSLFDWNTKFQTAVETTEGPEKYKSLSSTARDFGE